MQHTRSVPGHICACMQSSSWDLCPNLHYFSFSGRTINKGDVCRSPQILPTALWASWQPAFKDRRTKETLVTTNASKQSHPGWDALRRNAGGSYRLPARCRLCGGGPWTQRYASSRDRQTHSAAAPGSSCLQHRRVSKPCSQQLACLCLLPRDGQVHARSVNSNLRDSNDSSWPQGEHSQGFCA